MGVRSVMAGDGRWLQPEPLLGLGLAASDITNPGAWNPAYAGGNTYTGVDATGYCIEDLCIGEAIAAAALFTDAAASFLGVDEAVSVASATLVRYAPTVATAIGVTVAAEPVVEMEVEDLGPVLEETAEEVSVGAERTYQTYTKANPTTGQTYSGRTSGFGTPDENVAARDASHHMNAKGFDVAVLDKSSTDASAIRGREQQLIDSFGGAQSQGGSSGNAINGIGDRNPMRDVYLQAASIFGDSQ